MKKSIVTKTYQHLSDADLDAMLLDRAGQILQERIEAHRLQLLQDRKKIERDMTITRRVIRGESPSQIGKSYPEDFTGKDTRCVVAQIARKFTGM